jgi:hypothetical protein
MSSTYVLDTLTNDVLIDRLRALVTKNNEATAELLAHIGEVDARKLYLERGCSSMHTYCMEVLNFSEGAAFKRIRVARAARTYPSIFELIASGAVHLSGVTELAPVLTEENHSELLKRATGKSKRAIEELVRAAAPKPDVPQMIRKLPGPPPPTLFSAPKLAAPMSPPKPTPPPVVAPLSEDRFKLQVTVSRSLKDKIDRAKALMRHQIPDGDLEKVLERAVDELLAKLMRKKFAAAAKPKHEQPAASTKRTRRASAATKRAVAERDGYRCTFVSTDGHRCTECGFLELDHAKAYARGGQTTLENLRLRCRAHNAHAAELEFGKEHMLKMKVTRPGVS